MRSEDPAELDKENKAFLAIVPAAVAAENKARSTELGEIKADVKLIGNRPAGHTALDNPLLTDSNDVLKAYNVVIPKEYLSPDGSLYGSTDANIPISLGIPAISIGSGGEWGRAHSLDEYTDVEKGRGLKGMTVSLAILLTAANN